MYLVDLAHVGPVAPFLATQRDLALVLEASEDILRTTPRADLDLVLTTWETGLTWDSCLHREMTDAWYVRALLVTCIRGLRGEIAPKMWPLLDSE